LWIKRLHKECPLTAKQSVGGPTLATQ